MGVDLLNVEGLKDLEHQGPVVMVNLMRFRERSLDGDGIGLGCVSALQRADGADDQGARRHAAVDRRRQGGGARPARRQSMGLSRPGLLPQPSPRSST